MSKIVRAFVRVGDRDVFIRMAGRGRPLLLLHQSPRSSAELIPLIESLAQNYLVIAPDTPGNGASTPFASRNPEIEPFADNIAGLMNALGIAQAGVYGYHTGAAIGAAFALRYPHMAAFCILNGLPSFDAAERSDLLANYLPSFEPRWDGGHLTWLWARLREQTIHFPWYRAQPSARMAFDVPPAPAVQEAVMDFLAADDFYRAAYGAAFRQDASAIVPHLQTLTTIVATQRDPLRPHLDRIPQSPEKAEIFEISPGQEAVEDLINQRMAQTDLQSCKPIEGFSSDRGFLTLPDGQLHFRKFGYDGPAKNNRPLIVIDGRFGSSAVVERYAHAATLARPAVAVCLPGCGLSDELELSISKIPSGLGLSDATVKVLGGRNSDLLNEAPDSSGGHLLKAWNLVRFGHLFDNPRAPVNTGIRWDAALPDLSVLQMELLALLQQRSKSVSPDDALPLPDFNTWRAWISENA